MTVSEALSYIHSVSWKGSVPGLSRTQELLRRLGDPQDKLKFIHIAGTNGKGSTAAMLASILRAAGYQTGLYTSPYISCFNERMQVNGEMISDAELAQITENIRPHADTMEDVPTEFELVTAVAMVYFAQHECDIVVLEVGLGGELDSTNVISTPEAAVICNIGYDHTQVLGNTLEEIASAKAGIIKGGDAIIYRGTEGVEQVFAGKCAAVGARLHRAEFDALHLISESLRGQVFDCGCRKALELPLLGAHQRRNAAVALKTVDVLQNNGWRISEQAVYSGLKTVSWPGRFELLSEAPLFIVDGGHNPQCIAALTENVRTYLSDKHITALVGVMADKDYREMFSCIAPYISRFVAVTPDNPRAMPAQELAEVLRCFEKPVSFCDDVAQGVALALSQTGKDEAVLAFGSLYMVGTIRSTVKSL